MQVLHLQDETQYSTTQCLHSFIMCAMEDYQVISFPSEDAQLICDNGENVMLSNLNFTLSKLEESPYKEQFPGMNCYQLLIRSGEQHLPESTVEKMYLDGHINGTPQNGDYLKIKVSKRFPDEEYILQIKYSHIRTIHKEQEQVDYIAAIRVYTYRNKQQETISAILDFGSEASQVFFEGDKDANLNLREAFCHLTGCNNKKGYWQGRPDDDKEHQTLYKSIYHIHTEPGPTYFGDLPMNNKEKTFIQSLLPVDHQSFDDLVLLPNLKLIELLNYGINSTDVIFGKKVDADTGADAIDTNIVDHERVSLGTQELLDSILRQILCNFLAVVMYRKRSNGGRRQCLYFTLLVPNVYYQKKIAKIIDGLYQDFDILCHRHQDRFACYRCIEIQTVSESDASYLGVPTEKGSSAAKKGAHVLIIDAGKGTTDFSLIHQVGTDMSHYESIYRSGIPASGHVLTYAFYEALKQHFDKIGRKETFERLIREAFNGQNKQYLLTLTALLEKQKKNYVQFKDNEYDSSLNESAKGVNNWSSLKSYLDTLNNKEVLLPGTKEIVAAKVSEMVKLLNASIIQYTKKNKITLLKVYLSGRAFRFEPFREAVKGALIENKLITAPEQIVFDSDKAKNACLVGGINYATQAQTVNCQSSMLSVPTMFAVRNPKFKWIHNLFGMNKPKRAQVDFDFFYKGLRSSSLTNVEIDICGRTYQKGHITDTQFCLYFIGDGYLLKYGGKKNVQSYILPESAMNYSCDHELLEQLTLESLFPFDLKSMGYDDQETTSSTPESVTSNDSNSQVHNVGSTDAANTTSIYDD